jgi:heme O synthase-like polyprenyltransferase
VGVVTGGGLLLARNLELLRRPTDRRLALANFHASNLFLLLLFLGVVLDVGLRRW